jgi:hypothetical protein
MSLTIKDLSGSTAIDQGAMTTVRGGYIVAGPCPVEPPYLRYLPPCVGRLPIGFFPPADPGFHPDIY